MSERAAQSCSSRQNSTNARNLRFFNLPRDTDGLEEKRKEFNEHFSRLSETVKNVDKSGGDFLHNYAKKCVNVISAHQSMLDIDDPDGFEEMSTEITAANDDETIVGPSLHDYAKKISSEIGYHEYLSEDIFNSDRWKEIKNESNRPCETVTYRVETGGGPSLHDYAKKVVDDNESFLESFLDPGIFRETRKESNQGSNEILTNYVNGSASLHDYAKKRFYDHEDLLESILNPDMLKETRTETNQGSDEIIANYVGDCASGHDYAKKGIYNHGSLFESILDRNMLREMKKEAYQGSNEFFRTLTNNNGGASLHDYAKKFIDDHENSLSESILNSDISTDFRKEFNQYTSRLGKTITNNADICGEVHDYAKKNSNDIKDYENLKAKKFIDDNADLFSESIFNTDITRVMKREFNQYAIRLGKTITNNDEICGEVHDYAKKVSNEIEDHQNLLESIIDSEKLGGIGREVNDPGETVANFDGGGTSVHNYAKTINGSHDSLLEIACNNDTLERITNEFNNESNHLCNPVNNDGGIYEGASVHEYTRKITNMISDSEGLPEIISDIHRQEGMSNKQDQDFNKIFKSVTNDEIDEEASIYENDRNVVNVIEDHESIDDPGRKHRRMLTCLFCDEKFTSASSMLSHVSMCHYEMDKMLKIDDSQIRCKQCDTLVAYSKMQMHMNSHLSEKNKCQHCKLCFHSLKHFEEHLKTHINGENFCCFCGREFTNNRNKMIHINKVHKETRDNLCDICGLQFQSLQRLKSHLMSHHKIGEYSCSYCGKEFSSVSNKLMHMKLHSAEPHDFLCEVCGRLFFDLQSLVGHQRLHANQGDLLCKMCTKSFKTEVELDVHVSSHLKTFSCKVCSKLFHHKYLVRQHMLSHSDIKPFSCFCGSSFNRYGNLRKHMNKHECSKSSKKSGDKQISLNNFECGICKRNLKSKLRLRWHEAKHRGEKKPFDCNFCKCRFSKLHYYKVHMRKHTGERPYKCTVCDKAFRTLETLQEHTILHLPTNPFRCEECGQVFKQCNALKAHIVTHTGDKPYECQTCGRRYTQKASLSRHVKQHTNATGSQTSSCSEALIEVEPALTAEFSFGTANDPVLIRWSMK